MANLQTSNFPLETSLTPKLRFPEFRKWPGWEQSKLGEVVDFQSGGTPSKANPEFWNGDVPWVSAKDMKHPVLDETEDHLTSAAVADGANPVPGGTVLMLTRGMTLLKDVPICVLGRPMAFNQDVKALRAKAELDGSFLAWLLRGNKERLLKMVDVAGHGTGKLNTDELRALEVAVPSPAEQQKIADCLSSLDDLIAAEGRKLESLRAYKKGLMQQLFPRDGETTPRLRFPEFRDDHRSGFKQIGDFARVTTGAKDTQNKVDDGAYPFFVRSQTVERIDSFSQDGEAVLTSGDGVGVGENYHYINGKFDFHQRVYCIYAFDGSACGRFFYHYFSLHFKKRVKAMSAKNSVDSVRMAMITEMAIWFPAIAEQERIADCLTWLDGHITAQSERLTALRLHKKGLMQQLFPSAAAGVE